MAPQERGSIVRSHPTINSKIKEKKRHISLILLLPSAVFAILTCFVYLAYRAACIRKAHAGIIVWSVLLVEALIYGIYKAQHILQSQSAEVICSPKGTDAISCSFPCKQIKGQSAYPND